VVRAPGGQRLAVGGQGDAGVLVLRHRDLLQLHVGGHVPHEHRDRLLLGAVADAADGEGGAVGGQGDGGVGAGQSAIDLRQRLAGGGVPDGDAVEVEVGG